MYEIEITKAAQRDLKRLDKQTRARIVKAVSALSDDPRPAASKDLRNEWKGYRRLRVGDYRVVYRVERDRLVVAVVRVRHRREVYRE